MDFSLAKVTNPKPLDLAVSEQNPTSQKIKKTDP
jgi:hypothetical protein